MSVVVVGLNHRTVPLAVLEPMTVRGPALAKALADLRGRHNIGEAVVLSTCNRTEIYAVAERYHGAIADVRNFLSEHSGLAPDAFGDHLYAYHDETAVAHLFRVACGLDSAVVGETEILGQVREAWELARDEGAAGATLGRLFGHALAVGRRARAETAISRGTTSVAQAAVAMAAERLGSLEGRVVLVVGAGDVGQATAMALAAAPRVGQVVVANRSSDAAQALAVRVGGRAVGFSGLAPALAEVDVVFTCTGASVPVVDAVDLAPVITARAGRPLLIVDVAVPRDVDPGVADLAGVTLLDMDDLRASAEAAAAGRRGEIGAVLALVAAELERYGSAAAALEVAPLVAALRERAEAARAGELDRYRSRLGPLDPVQAETIDALTRAIVNKLLHSPTARLKEAAGSGRQDRLAEALRALFDL